MRKTFTATALVVALVAAAAMVTGCTRVRLADDPKTRTTRESKTVARGGAGSVETEIRMKVGELRLSVEPSATDLLRADFLYAPASWKPTVSYKLASGVGRLLVEQPDAASMTAFRDLKNNWELVVDGEVPTKLKLRLGVGTSAINLRGANLTSIDAVTGVGETTIDLSGPRTRDLTGRIEAGVGSITVHLPKTIGVRVTGRQDGVGDFTADGFKAEGNSWVNDAYSGPGPKIDIDFVRGVGDAKLVLED